MEVVDAVIGVWGKDRVGVRLAPYGKVDEWATAILQPVRVVLHGLSQKGVEMPM